ncbi:MAG: ATP-binding protein [Treponema sp.]|nr:ATP-binding protein [Treponema sp.]
MKKIVTASTNPIVTKTITNACKNFSAFSCNIFGDTDSIISFINYELPDIKVIDYTSPTIRCDKILESIHEDSWLHYGGVISVCKDRDQARRLEDLKDENVLSILTIDEFAQNFTRLLRIIDQNQQFLYARGMQDIIGGREEGSFICGNDPLDIRFYINFMVSYLYNTNRISSEDRGNLQMTLSELLTNAVEHGNLNISYQEKTEWLMNGGNIMDLIKTRAEDPKYRGRKIRINYSIHDKASAFRITDNGDGFDWRKMLESRASEDETHGRGISLSRSFVKKLVYNEKGNQVTFQIANQINSVNAVPGIMKPFDVLEYKDKQIVCRQDEMSNDLFFIVAGKFGVYVNLKLNTVLTPSDMFIGEMAFLLNDRRTATVMAIGNCKLIKVPKTAFLSLIRKNPHYGIFLSKMLAQRLALQSQNAYVIQQKFDELQSALQAATDKTR